MEGPGCCMEPTIPLGLASGILGPFLYPHENQSAIRASYCNGFSHVNFLDTLNFVPSLLIISRHIE